MKIRKVTAHAFGPLTGETLDLAPGLTVITGANEAGKSTWHAAIFAALCGIRRGRGQPTKEDREFAGRHKPWGSDLWKVDCELELADGRTIELHHDLSGKVDCTAHDTGLGKDISGQLMHDGAPDGSKLLGMKRAIFRAVACIRQADILGIKNDASTLQDDLQRAAATSGTGDTAETAIRKIRDFKTEKVGTERANSTKPLRTAMTKRERAHEELVRANREHTNWLDEQVSVAEREAHAAESEAALGAAEWEQRRRRVEGLEAAFDEARELDERYPTAPSGLTDDDDLADSVNSAVSNWNGRPTPVAPAPPTVEELEAELAAIPEVPDGDLEPDGAAKSAADNLRYTKRRIDDHQNRRPEAVPSTIAPDCTPAELNDLARQLREVVNPADPQLQARVDELRAANSADRARLPKAVMIGGAIGTLIALTLLVTGNPVAGAAVIAVVAAVLAGTSNAWRSPARSSVDDELRQAETRLEVANQHREGKQQQLDAARARARQLGLPDDPAELQRLIEQVSQAEQARQRLKDWEDAGTRLDDELAGAASDLRAALERRSIATEPQLSSDDLLAVYDKYDRSCGERRQLASAAARRLDLERLLDDRRQAQDRFTRDLDQARTAEQSVRDAARQTGVVADNDDSTPDELVGELQEWLRQRTDRRNANEQARREWQQLQLLLDGRSIDDLAARLDREKAAFEAMDIPTRFMSDGVVLFPDDIDPIVERRRQEAQAARTEAAAATSALEVKAQRLQSVAEAEETLAAAEQELKRLRDLESTLDLADQFLNAAKERVHRNIAPVLQAKVSGRLDRITGGRYQQVTVNPDDLVVTVRDQGGKLRNADQLSHGTEEQIYLLLRIAIAEIFTAGNSPCPLLLDDVTVHSDPVRTRAVLDVLHEASAHHQIILFSQEEAVADWASQHLTDRDALVSLPPVASRSGVAGGGNG